VLPEFPPARRAGAVGLWGAAGGLAAAAGPTLGALLIQGPGWRWVFLINVPLCLVAVLVGRRVLRETTSTPSTSGQDLLGVLLVVTVFGLLSLGLVQGQAWGWSSWRVVACFVVAVVLVPVLVLRGLRHPSPAFPARLFAVPTFSVASAALLLFSAAFFAVILCNVLFLSSVWHYSLLRTAVSVLPSPLLAAMLSPVSGRLADRFGFRVLAVPGALSMAAGVTWFVLHTGTQPAYVSDFLPGSILVGVAIGLAFSSLSAASAQALQAHQFGAGSAVTASARQLGAVIGVSVLVAVLGTPSPATALEAFHRSWTFIAVTAAVGALVSLGLVSRAQAGTDGPQR